MQKLRKFLIKTERNRTNRGSTMIESVISIPLLAIIAGILAFCLAQSLIAMHNNNTALSAANDIQKVMGTLESKQNCYDLKTALADDSLFAVDENKGYKITHTATDCGTEPSVTVHLEAVRTSDSHIIFDTTSKNFIQGSGYAAPTP